MTSTGQNWYQQGIYGPNQSDIAIDKSWGWTFFEENGYPSGYVEPPERTTQRNNLYALLLDSGNNSSPIKSAQVTANVTYWIYDGTNYTNHSSQIQLTEDQNHSGFYIGSFYFYGGQPSGSCQGCHSAHGGDTNIGYFPGNYTAVITAQADNKIMTSQVSFEVTPWGCEDCHGSGNPHQTKLLGIDSYCYLCHGINEILHAKDDAGNPHQNTAHRNIQCTDCHTNKALSPQSFNGVSFIPGGIGNNRSLPQYNFIPTELNRGTHTNLNCIYCHNDLSLPTPPGGYREDNYTLKNTVNNFTPSFASIQQFQDYYVINVTQEGPLNVTLDWEGASNIGFYLYPPNFNPGNRTTNFSSDKGDYPYYNGSTFTNKPENYTNSTPMPGKWILAVYGYDYIKIGGLKYGQLQQPLNYTINSTYPIQQKSLPGVPECSSCHYSGASGGAFTDYEIPDWNPGFAHVDTNNDGALDIQCRMCHNAMHDITVKDCRNCHITAPAGHPIGEPTFSGYTPVQCLACHGDPHRVTLAGGTDCIACHVPGDVDISKFARHAGLNTSDGTGIVSNYDCWTCHYQQDMNRSHVYLCDSCHKNSTGVVPVNDPSLIVGNLKHGSNTCKSCHAPDTYHVQGTAGSGGRVENPGWQLISPVNYAGCHDCHTNHNGLDEPFHGPGIAVESGGNHILGNKNATDPGNCGFSCHNSPLTNVTTHKVDVKSQGQKPIVVDMSLTPSTVIITNPVEIIANGSKTNKFLPIEAAQYQVRDNLDRIVIDWASMNAKDGKFNSSYETANATLNTAGLAEGTYKVSVRVMASAPRTIKTKPYYPLNGDFSAPMNATLVIEQPKGFLNGTVMNSSSDLPIEGAIVATNTSVNAITNAAGFYSLNLPNGTYLLNVTKDPEYNYNNTIPPATVMAYTTAIQDVLLTPKPVYSLSGKVTNASSGLGINGAVVQLDAYSQYNATTNITGDYSMNVPGGTYQVSASASGYATNVTTVAVNSNKIQDFALVLSSGIFIPWIAYSQTDWYTPIQVQNIGVSAADVSVSMYDQNGNLVTTQTTTIQPNTASVFWPPAGPTAGGSAVVTSTQNVIAIVNEMPKNGLDGMSYSGLTLGSTKVYMPWIAYSQTDWYTPIQVQNIDSVSADVSVAMYDQNGNPVATQTATIQPNTASVFWPPVGSTAGGSAVITSTRAVIAIVNEMGKVTPQAMSYEGFNAGSKKVYIPAINFSQTNTYTPIQVQNIGTASASVTVNIYDSTGALIQTQNGVIPPNTASVFWPPAASTAYGSAVIESDQDVIAIVNAMINNNQWAMSYDGFAAGSVQIFIPWIAYGNSGWYTPLYIQNTGTVSSNVAVAFYDQNGAAVETRNAVIPANTSQIFVPAYSAPTTGGSAVITSDQPLAAVVNEINAASNMQALAYGGMLV